MLKSGILTKLDASSSKKGSSLIPPSTPTPTPTPQQKSPASEKQTKTYTSQSKTPIAATIFKKDEQMRLAAEREKTAAQTISNANSGSTRNPYNSVSNIPSKLDFFNYLVSAMTEDKKSSTSSYGANKSNTSGSSSSGTTSKNATSQFEVPDKLDLFNRTVAAMLMNSKDSSNHGAGIASSNRSTSGNSFTPPKNQQVGTKPEQGIPEDYVELADIVAELPNDFDLTNWDDKTAMQQHKALTNSGLSGEDQMKLLNSPTSIETLAKIQDIQANRIEYGLTQAKANQISAGLLEIANARIGVKNREIPFTTSSQRNIFLAQLDKEEQKLLESVNGQEPINYDKVFKDKRSPNSGQENETTKPKFVSNVDNESKLGRTAKNVLKYYLNAAFLNRANNIVSNLNFFGAILDKGTISVGMSGNASLFFAGGVTGNVGLVIDAHGDVGVITSYGGYGGTPSASAVFFASVSNADDISNLAGESFEIGGSISLTPTVIAPAIGGETSVFTDKETGKTYFSFSVNGGAAVGPPILPVEGHAGLTTSQVVEKFNLFDEWTRFLEDYRAW